MGVRVVVPLFDVSKDPDGAPRAEWDPVPREARIVSCRRCPRLVAWREQVGKEKRLSLIGWDYWARPVPDLGDPHARRLIVGLAPAAHGANRTGQMFTGDRSGAWLFRALHKAGVANRPNAERVEDGLQLYGVLITAICHCAPPDNKPTPGEVAACSDYLVELLESRHWCSILCLGGLAWNRTLRSLGVPPMKFGHGVVGVTAKSTKLVASYHPSQQNTFTGKLTEAMLDDAIATFLSS